MKVSVTVFYFRYVTLQIYPLDAMFSTPEEIPEDVKTNKRYAGLTGYDIKSCAEKIKKDYGKVDILVHSLANGPEVTKPLLDTSRAGYGSIDILNQTYYYVRLAVLLTIDYSTTNK